MEKKYGIDELNDLAFLVWESLKNEESRVIALHGEMGAGKTTFSAALIKAMGSSDAGSSPTFSIINQYRNANGTPIFHMDWYRLDDEEEVMQAGGEDTLYSGHWCLVEWSEKAPALLPDNTIHISLALEPDGKRKLVLRKPEH
jgi:tRNA threonylcarbamoyladenosine biosynthesis protein TsaE